MEFWRREKKKIISILKTEEKIWEKDLNGWQSAGTGEWKVRYGWHSLIRLRPRHNPTTIVIINHHCGMIVSNQIETGAMDGILLSPDCTHQVTLQFSYFVIIIMMIVSNQIETGKVQYVWMAFSHQTAPRSGSSLNISQILLFSNVPLLSSKYRLFHNCPKRKKYFYTIVAGAEQKLFRLWVGGRFSICIFCGTGGLVFPWYFLYGLVEGILFPDHMSDTCHIHHFSIFISTYRFFFFNLFQSNGQKTMRNVMINIFITFNMYLAILAIVLYYMVL